MYFIRVARAGSDVRDPGASPAAHKIEKSNFFFRVHDIIKKSFSSVHSLFYMCVPYKRII